MKGNWFLLLAALCLLLALIGVAMGAHLYRWEAITWLAVGISSSVSGYLYSRWWAEK